MSIGRQESDRRGRDWKTMAAVKIDVRVGEDERRKQCDLVTFDELARDVVHGDEIVVWYRVSTGYRAKSGDWIGLFQCGDDDDDDYNCCIAGTYSYVSFQWAPKYPNIEKSIPRRRVVFNNEQIKVYESDHREPRQIQSPSLSPITHSSSSSSPSSLSSPLHLLLLVQYFILN